MDAFFIISNYPYLILVTPETNLYAIANTVTAIVNSADTAAALN